MYIYIYQMEMACRKASGKEWPPSKAQFSSLGNMIILPALLNLSYDLHPQVMMG